ncbi:MAG: hormogonium polysaccharide biosynthesis protein HpsA, partial [Cyanobacteriota bacterium]|nr:hormogonium polysaccharide biosynthesis protein HpsA [Cyanobacteriota bacterium]
PPTGLAIGEALANHELDTGRPKDRISATDFWLDPTRRVSGVLLVNGKRIGRNPPSNIFRAEEKGLILATNLPVYIKAQEENSGTPTSTKPGFNVHDHEEFNTALTDTWGNFYDRTAGDLNKQFACRRDDPRLSECTQGDQWRSVAILSDAITLLSDTFRFGFRNEGDFDLRNNQVDNAFRNIRVPQTTANLNGLITPAKDSSAANGPNTPTDFTDSIEEKRLFNGFFDNNFATNGLSSGNPTPAPNNPFPFQSPYNAGNPYTDNAYVSASAANAPLYSSYFNNFVTPIQRRGTFSEYLMETCPKLPVSECDPVTDWSVDGAGLNASDEVGTAFAIATHQAGTTARAPNTADLQKYARRVAFLRYTPPSANAGNLFLDAQGNPIPLGIVTGGAIQCYTSGGTGPFDIDDDPSTPGVTCAAFGNNVNNRPRTQPNALLYRTVNGNNPYANPGTQQFRANRRLFFAEDFVGVQRAGTNAPDDRTQAQPLLIPILQIHRTTATTGDLIGGDQYRNHWLPWASSSINNPPFFNLIMAAGDTPGRTSEFNGALANFPRFLENWARDRDFNNPYPLRIQGSFIQLKRSAYATAPFWQLLGTSVNGTRTSSIATNPNATNGFLFRYPQSYKANNNSSQPYEPPERLWGFDVGLLSQLPDAFAKKLNRNSTEEPNEYYREASRDDDWVKALLCAVQVNANGTPGAAAINRKQRPEQFCQDSSRLPF